MARLAIPIYLMGARGTIGDLTYYKRGKEYFVRKKGKRPDADQIATEPRFLRTRQSMAEFGRAAKAAQQFRKAFELLDHPVKSNTLYTRLVQQMMKIVTSDTVNERGRRCITDGVVKLFKGFNFNESKGLEELLFVDYTTHIDRSKGMATVSIPAFRPRRSINMPSWWGLHFRIVSSVIEINLETGCCDVKQSSTPIFLKSQRFPGFEINHPVRADSSNIIVLLLGVEFYNKSAKKSYEPGDEANNALQVVDVSSK